MSSYPGPVILGLALPLVVAPPNLQNQLTLTSEDALNYHGFDRSLQNASVGGEGLEKYNPSQFARVIRPLAVVITSESRA